MEIYRGDIFYVKKNDNNRFQGSEQFDERPAIVVSNNKCNEHSPVVEVVYLTTQDKKPLPTHVEVLCQVPSTALCEQVISINKGRLTSYIRSCTDEEMDDIDKALMVSLGLDYYVNLANDADGTNYEADQERNAEYERKIMVLKDKLKKAEDYAAMLESDIKILKERAEVEQQKETNFTDEFIQSVRETELQLAMVTGERDAYKAMLEKMMN